MIAVTSFPTVISKSSIASKVIDDVICCPLESSIFTIPLTAPLVTSVTLPINLFLALNFMTRSPYKKFLP